MDRSGRQVAPWDWPGRSWAPSGRPRRSSRGFRRIRRKSERLLAIQRRIEDKISRSERHGRFGRRFSSIRICGPGHAAGFCPASAGPQLMDNIQASLLKIVHARQIRRIRRYHRRQGMGYISTDFGEADAPQAPVKSTKTQGKPNMQLYDSFGPNPRAMRMFLAEKGITIPTKTIELLKGENRQAP